MAGHSYCAEKRMNYLTFYVNGDNAMFTDPDNKSRDEIISYPIPTYSALCGICESIYWMPTFHWHIRRVRVMNPILTEEKGMLYPCLSRGIDAPENKICRCHYLADVAYQVEAEIVWAEDRPDLAKDRIFGKHMAIARRALSRGGRFPIFLGKKEGFCYGYVYPCEFGEGEGAYDNVDIISFGNVLHSLVYPTAKNPRMYARYWPAAMRRGVIEFPKPQECPRSLMRRVTNHSGSVIF